MGWGQAVVLPNTEVHGYSFKYTYIVSVRQRTVIVFDVKVSYEVVPIGCS